MIEEFRAAMQAAGLDYQGEIIPDAPLQRFKANGDKKKDSWYALHLDCLPAGSFGCWKRGISQTWCIKSADVLTDEERAERDRRWKQQQQERDVDRLRQQNQASTKTAEILAAAQPANDDHLYLVRKAVKAAPGVKSGEWLGKPNCLLIPLRTASGQLATIQAISPDAPFAHSGQSKDFLKGGAKQGVYFVFGDLVNSPVILVAEGYATAATLHEATGYAAVMACDTSGLTPVTQALKTLYPHPKIILICGDNNRTTEGNPGEKAARAASKKVGVRVTLPHFEDDEAGSDFNDLATLHGLDVVKTAIESALAGHRLVEWQKWDSKAEDFRRCSVPPDIAKRLLSRAGMWNFPALTGVVTAPTLRPDGSLIDAPGYDKTTGLFLDFQGEQFPVIPDAPTMDQGKDALALLVREVLENRCIGDDEDAGFAFASPAAKSAALRQSRRRCRRFLPPWCAIPCLKPRCICLVRDGLDQENRCWLMTLR